ncbi:ATP-binding protein [Robertmurraya korlensis]|uniref:ATP-binding protein n=1 Tax=Robertmurraya korlensis TaxID=519977 RepID=UPI00203B1A89|nr:ATP-binding protein [Robertmurraya korlensis]MCM3601901.1 ATP-binding protein [Robertmurraya korlensis]
MANIGDETKSILLKDFIDINIKKGFSILSKSKDAFLVISSLGNMEYASQPCEDLLGYSTNHLLRLGLKDLFDTEILKEGHSFYEGKAQGKRMTFESRVKGKDDKVIDVTVTLMPIYLKDQWIGSYIILEQSINNNDSNDVIDQLAQLSEKRATAGHLAAGIAHEIRNPITAIKGFLQLLKDEHAGNEVYYGVINSEIERIELILRELMVLAKPNKQKYERVDIQLLLDQVLTLMEPHALLNNIQLQRNIYFNNSFLLGDTNQLKQVFINFIKNSIEAMPDGGNITIEGRVLTDLSIEVSIVDEGCGMPKEVLDRVGELFFTTKENGTGLGMLVSQQIIKEHKGTIVIESDSEGTCVKVRFMPRENELNLVN